MRELKMKLCVLMLPLVVSACGSTPPVQASVREATATTRVGNDASVELSSVAGRNVLGIRWNHQRSGSIENASGIYPYSVPEIVFSMRCIVAVFPH